MIPAITELSKAQVTVAGGAQAHPTQFRPSPGMEKLTENHGEKSFKLTEWYAGLAHRKGDRVVGKGGKNTHR